MQMGTWMAKTVAAICRVTAGLCRGWGERGMGPEMSMVSAAHPGRWAW